MNSRSLFKKTKAVTTQFKGQTLAIPAGLRAVRITSGATAGNYFVDEFPTSLFPINSIIRHDAVHYGVMLTPSEVE